MEHISNKEKAKEIANIYRDRMLQMSQICDNDWLIIELVNDVLEWKDEQHKQERQQWIDKVTEWLRHNIYDYFYWIEMEGESEANIKDTLFDDFKKAMKGE